MALSSLHISRPSAGPLPQTPHSAVPHPSLPQLPGPRSLNLALPDSSRDPKQLPPQRFCTTFWTALP